MLSQTLLSLKPQCSTLEFRQKKDIILVEGEYDLNLYKQAIIRLNK
jgi:hypothetical protein